MLRNLHPEDKIHVRSMSEQERTQFFLTDEFWSLWREAGSQEIPTGHHGWVSLGGSQIHAWMLKLVRESQRNGMSPKWLLPRNVLTEREK